MYQSIFFNSVNLLLSKVYFQLHTFTFNKLSHYLFVCVHRILWTNLCIWYWWLVNNPSFLSYANYLNISKIASANLVLQKWFNVLRENNARLQYISDSKQCEYQDWGVRRNNVLSVLQKGSQWIKHKYSLRQYGLSAW